MSTLIGQGPLVPIAFGEVQADGTASLNSGVTVTKPGTGVYRIVLPSDLGQEDGSFLVFMQLKSTSVALRNTILNYSYDEPTRTLEVEAYSMDASGFVDAAFDFMILRPTYPDAVED